MAEYHRKSERDRDRGGRGRGDRDDGDREPGRVCPVECGEERVDAHRDRAWQRLGRQGRRDREEYRDGDESGEKTGHVGRHSKAG